MSVQDVSVYVAMLAKVTLNEIIKGTSILDMHQEILVAFGHRCQLKTLPYKYQALMLAQRPHNNNNNNNFLKHNNKACHG